MHVNERVHNGDRNDQLCDQREATGAMEADRQYAFQLFGDGRQSREAGAEEEAGRYARFYFYYTITKHHYLLLLLFEFNYKFLYIV